MAWATTPTFTVGQVLTAAQQNTLGGNINALGAVGTYQYVAALAGTAATVNIWQGAWLEANGAEFSRTTYAALDSYLAGLGTVRPFGAGNGTTTTNLPDLSGRGAVSMSPSTGHADVKTIGNNDGVAIGSRRPKHITSITDPGHVHTEHDAASGAGSGSSGSLTTEGTRNTGLATTGITAGVASAAPTDTAAYLVGGIWVIKALA